MDYLTNDTPSNLLTAEEARRLASRKEERNDVNYNLTLHRLMRIINNESRNGMTMLTFETPRFVLDGSLADPILLARQLSKRLKMLGYRVKRNEHVLNIEW